MPQFLFFHTIFISQKEYFPHQKSEASPGSPSATVELSILEENWGKGDHLIPQFNPQCRGISET